MRDKTIVRVLQKSKKSKDGPIEINSSIKLLTKRNDRWLNSHHSKPFMKVWNANIDIQLTIDVGKIVSYMTKYVTKTETCHTPRTRRLFFSTLNQISQENADTTTVLKRLMTKLMGERTRSKQETCHLMNSIPLVACSHILKKVDLRNTSREITRRTNDDGDDNEPVTFRKTIIDAYAVRMYEENWLSHDEFSTACENGLEDWTLNTFAARFAVGVKQEKAGKIFPHYSPKTVICYQPNLSSNKKNETYSEYCKHSLVRYVCWRDNYHSVFENGEDSTPNDWVAQWENHLQNLAESGEDAPEHLRNEMNRLL